MMILLAILILFMLKVEIAFVNEFDLMYSVPLLSVIWEQLLAFLMLGPRSPQMISIGK